MELKPCPFCGGAVELEQTINRDQYGERPWWGVVCRNTGNVGGSCALQIRPSASEQAAIQRWNLRVLAAALEAENAALREKLATAEARTVLTDEFTRVGASIARKADRIIVASAISAEWADRLISASAAPAAQEDAKRLDWILEWLERDGSLSEFNPAGHITRTTRGMRLAAIDAAIAANTPKGT